MKTEIVISTTSSFTPTMLSFAQNAIRFPLAVCVSFAFLVSAAQSQTDYTWAGGTANWDAAASWTPAGGPPGTGDSIVNAASGATRMNIRSDITTDITLQNADFTQMGGTASILNNSGDGHVDFTITGDLIKRTTQQLTIRGHTGGTMAFDIANIDMDGGRLDLGAGIYAATALNVHGTANLSGSAFFMTFAHTTTAQFNNLNLGGGLLMTLTQAETGNTYNVSVNNLTGTAGTGIRASSAGSGANVVNLSLNPTGTADFAGALTNGPAQGNHTLNVLMDGPGTQIFSGDTHTYSGTTTINNGALMFNNIHSGTGLVSVNNNGAIGGSGTLAGGLTLNTGADLMFLGTPGTALTVVGATILDGGFGIDNLRVSDWAGIAFGTYDLLLTSEDFSSLILNWGEGNKVTGLAGGREAYFTFASSGTDGLAVTVIPEPGSVALILATLAGVIVIGRRRIHKLR